MSLYSEFKTKISAYVAVQQASNISVHVSEFYTKLETVDTHSQDMEETLESLRCRYSVLAWCWQKAHQAFEATANIVI
jgi:hypothetical protein